MLADVLLELMFKAAQSENEISSFQPVLFVEKDVLLMLTLHIFLVQTVVPQIFSKPVVL